MNEAQEALREQITRKIEEVQALLALSDNLDRRARECTARAKQILAEAKMLRALMGEPDES